MPEVAIEVLMWWMKSARLLVATAALSLSACQNAQHSDSNNSGSNLAEADEEQCEADKNWLTAAKEPPGTAIPDTDEDCSFYKAAVEQYLWATRPHDGTYSFLTFPTIDQLFGKSSTPLFPATRSGFESAALRVAKAPNAINAPASGELPGTGIRQAGDVQGVLADSAGNPIFYSIHVSPAFAQFIKDNSLTTADALRNAAPDLRFPSGVAEYKAAWQIIDPKHAPAGMILIPNAHVPTLKIKAGELVIDSDHPRTVTLGLIAFHVAFTTENHPEMIWATFEHAPGGVADVAPSAEANPSTSPVKIKSATGISYALFPTGASATTANQPASTAEFDEATQKFRKPSPVYRAFPASKEPSSETEMDGAIEALNEDLRKIAGSDIRAQYQLVGAVWLKHPAAGFGVGKRFRNLPEQSTDDPKAMLSGEGALSSTAMESFTQTSFTNCFACHDTRAVSRDTEPFDKIIDAKMLNVSHVISRFLAETPEKK